MELEGIYKAIKIKDSMQTELITILDLKDAVLQGGGALHHIYQSPRFSADLDYVVKEMPSQEDLEEICKNTAETIGLPIDSFKIKIKEKLARLKFYKSFNQMQKIATSVEIYCAPSYDSKIIDFKNKPIKVESQTEILADKYIANLERIKERGSIKLRDLYDIWFITQFLKPDLKNFDAYVSAKIKDYSINEPNPKKIIQYLDLLVPELLYESLRGYLKSTNQLDMPQIISAAKDLYAKK